APMVPLTRRVFSKVPTLAVRIVAGPPLPSPAVCVCRRTLQTVTATASNSKKTKIGHLWGGDARGTGAGRIGSVGEGTGAAGSGAANPALINLPHFHVITSIPA